MNCWLVLSLLFGSMQGSQAVDTLSGVVLPLLNTIIQETPNYMLFNLNNLETIVNLSDTLFGSDSTIFSQLLDTAVDLEPEVTMNTTERIEYHGFIDEIHYVTTQDGYMLRLDRVRTSTPLNASARPLLLIPGTLCQSEAWFGNTKENILPFLMANENRDVWLISVRGSESSRGHVNMTASDPKYWDFSFDELARYDMPATVDYILTTTGHQQLYMAGHSLGGGLPMIFLSELPQYNAKVRGIFGFAPLGNTADVENPVIRLAFNNEPIVEMLAKLISLYELHIPLNKRELGTLITVMGPLFQLPIMKYIGPDNKLWNNTRAANYFAALLTSTSFRLLCHYGQSAMYNGRKGLLKYDFGREENQKRYGTDEPPSYDLSKVTAPVHLYWGKDDFIISFATVTFLNNNLGNVASFNAVPDYGHLDFLWDANVAVTLFNPIIQYMIQNN